MEYDSLEAIYKQIDEVRDALCKRVEPLTEMQANFAPAAEKWPIAKLVEHLALSEELIVARIDDTLSKAETAGLFVRPAGSSINPVSLDHLKPVASAQTFTAPPRLQATGGRSIPDSIQKLQASRAALHMLRPRFEKLELSSVGFPHPVFGELNLYQWLLFGGLHEDRHLNQIEAVMASEGFPAGT